MLSRMRMETQGRWVSNDQRNLTICIRSTVMPFLAFWWVKIRGLSVYSKEYISSHRVLNHIRDDRKWLFRTTKSPGQFAIIPGPATSTSPQSLEFKTARCQASVSSFQEFSSTVVKAL